MIQTKTFQKSMEKKGLWEIVKPFVAQSSTNISSGGEKVFVELLDKNLPLEKRLEVMEELGCCKNQKHQAPFKAFYQKFADKTLKERVLLMTELDPMGHRVLNDDGTLSVFWAYGEENNYTCVCPCEMMREVKASENPSVSSTFCACCGGHAKALAQTALGIKLKLKSVVSSAISTGGKKRCEFLFDII